MVVQSPDVICSRQIPISLAVASVAAIGMGLAMPVAGATRIRRRRGRPHSGRTAKALSIWAF